MINKEFVNVNFIYANCNINAVEENVIINKYTYLDPDLIENSSVADTVTCPVCTSIVIDPKCCDECKHGFCSKCVEEIRKTSNAQNKKCNCPLCKKELKVSNIDPFAKRMMDSIKIKCFNDGCNTFVNLGEYDMHLKKCNKSTLKCKHCNILKSYNDMAEHLKICPQVLVKCKKCSKELKISDSVNHFESHDKISCQFCNNTFPSKLIEGHYKICDKSKICDGCEKRVSLFDDHDKNICYSTTIKLKDYYKKDMERQKKDLEIKENETKNLKKRIEELETTSKLVLYLS